MFLPGEVTFLATDSKCDISPTVDNVYTCNNDASTFTNCIFKSSEMPYSVICCEGDVKPPMIMLVLALLSTKLMFPSAEGAFLPPELMFSSVVIAAMIFYLQCTFTCRIHGFSPLS